MGALVSSAEASFSRELLLPLLTAAFHLLLSTWPGPCGVLHLSKVSKCL